MVELIFVKDNLLLAAVVLVVVAQVEIPRPDLAEMEEVLD